MLLSYKKAKVYLIIINVIFGAISVRERALFTLCLIPFSTKKLDAISICLAIVYGDFWLNFRYRYGDEQ